MTENSAATGEVEAADDSMLLEDAAELGDVDMDDMVVDDDAAGDTPGLATTTPTTSTKQTKPTKHPLRNLKERTHYANLPPDRKRAMLAKKAERARELYAKMPLEERRRRNYERSVKARFVREKERLERRGRGGRGGSGGGLTLEEFQKMEEERRIRRAEQKAKLAKLRAASKEGKGGKGGTVGKAAKGGKEGKAGKAGKATKGGKASKAPKGIKIMQTKTVHHDGKTYTYDVPRYDYEYPPRVLLSGKMGGQLVGMKKKSLLSQLTGMGMDKLQELQKELEKLEKLETRETTNRLEEEGDGIDGKDGKGGKDSSKDNKKEKGGKDNKKGKDNKDTKKDSNRSIGSLTGITWRDLWTHQRETMKRKWTVVQQERWEEETREEREREREILRFGLGLDGKGALLDDYWVRKDVDGGEVEGKEVEGKEVGKEEMKVAEDADVDMRGTESDKDIIAEPETEEQRLEQEEREEREKRKQLLIQSLTKKRDYSHLAEKFVWPLFPSHSPNDDGHGGAEHPLDVEEPEDEELEELANVPKLPPITTPIGPTTPTGKTATTGTVTPATPLTPATPTTPQPPPPTLPIAPTTNALQNAYQLQQTSLQTYQSALSHRQSLQSAMERELGKLYNEMRESREREEGARREVRGLIVGGSGVDVGGKGDVGGVGADGSEGAESAEHVGGDGSGSDAEMEEMEEKDDDGRDAAGNPESYGKDVGGSADTTSTKGSVGSKVAMSSVGRVGSAGIYELELKEGRDPFNMMVSKIHSFGQLYARHTQQGGSTASTAIPSFSSLEDLDAQVKCANEAMEAFRRWMNTRESRDLTKSSKSTKPYKPPPHHLATLQSIQRDVASLVAFVGMFVVQEKEDPKNPKDPKSDTANTVAKTDPTANPTAYEQLKARLLAKSPAKTATTAPADTTVPTAPIEPIEPTATTSMTTTATPTNATAALEATMASAASATTTEVPATPTAPAAPTATYDELKQRLLGKSPAATTATTESTATPAKATPTTTLPTLEINSAELHRLKTALHPQSYHSPNDQWHFLLEQFKRYRRWYFSEESLGYLPLSGVSGVGGVSGVSGVGEGGNLRGMRGMRGIVRGRTGRTGVNNGEKDGTENDVVHSIVNFGKKKVVDSPWDSGSGGGANTNTNASTNPSSPNNTATNMANLANMAVIPDTTLSLTNMTHTTNTGNTTNTTHTTTMSRTPRTTKQPSKPKPPQTAYYIFLQLESEYLLWCLNHDKAVEPLDGADGGSTSEGAGGVGHASGRTATADIKDSKTTAKDRMKAYHQSQLQQLGGVGLEPADPNMPARYRHLKLKRQWYRQNRCKSNKVKIGLCLGKGEEEAFLNFHLRPSGWRAAHPSIREYCKNLAIREKARYERENRRYMRYLWDQEGQGTVGTVGTVSRGSQVGRMGGPIVVGQGGLGGQSQGTKTTATTATTTTAASSYEALKARLLSKSPAKTAAAVTATTTPTVAATTPTTFATATVTPPNHTEMANTVQQTAQHLAQKGININKLMLWTQKQQHKYYSNVFPQSQQQPNLPTSHFQKLLRAGFTFDVCPDLLWQECVRRLIWFKDEFGHVFLPTEGRKDKEDKEDKEGMKKGKSKIGRLHLSDMSDFTEVVVFAPSPSSGTLKRTYPAPLYPPLRLQEFLHKVRSLILQDALSPRRVHHLKSVGLYHDLGGRVLGYHKREARKGRVVRGERKRCKRRRGQMDPEELEAVVHGEPQVYDARKLAVHGPTKNDVIVSPHGINLNEVHNGNIHLANKRYWELVKQAKNSFVSMSSFEDALVALDMVQEWRANAGANVGAGQSVAAGRFLRLEDSSREWRDVEDEEVVKQTMKMFNYLLDQGGKGKKRGRLSVGVGSVKVEQILNDDDQLDNVLEDLREAKKARGAEAVEVVDLAETADAGEVATAPEVAGVAKVAKVGGVTVIGKMPGAAKGSKLTKSTEAAAEKVQVPIMLKGKRTTRSVDSNSAVDSTKDTKDAKAPTATGATGTPKQAPKRAQKQTPKQAPKTTKTTPQRSSPRGAQTQSKTPSKTSPPSGMKRRRRS